MTQIPPGISYLLRKAPSLLLPSVLVYAGAHQIQAITDTHWPRWLVVCLSVVAKPLQFWISVQLARARDAREARRLGARIAPPVEDSALTIMSKLLEMFERGYPGDALQGWIEKHGNVYQTRLFTDSFTMLATDFENWPKEPLFIEQAYSLMGNGIFASNGESRSLGPGIWKFHRSMARPFFTRDRISDFENFDAHAMKALDLAKQRLADGYAIDFQELTARFTLDSATVYLLDEDVNSLDAGLAYPHNCVEENAGNKAYLEHPSNSFANAFLASITETTRRTFLGREWPLLEFWSDKVKPHRDVVDNFSERVIQRHLERRSKVDESGEKDTFLADLLDKTQDATLIKDATSCTLSYAMYELTRNPDIAARLREDILNQGFHQRYFLSLLSTTKLVSTNVSEVLRLYPPVYSKRATVLPYKDSTEKIYVPAETAVRYSVFVMHRRKDLWGPDADDFDPDRFLDERSKKYLTKNPYIFVPFNAGPRICLGQQFAYNEVSLFLVRLFQQFSEFTFARDAQEHQFVPPESWAACEGTKGTTQIMIGANLAMYIKGGLWVRMK
ncbi:cytochrome P450 monooxygenase pc-2 [Coprinopsis sp. MPI-PUGE-AT-0042]|nr:cytochrome P450 monooxygenase pc-2 [Coprinopsis sp. MPI-PUGE-AT-0042]